MKNNIELYSKKYSKFKMLLAWAILMLVYTYVGFFFSTTDVFKIPKPWNTVVGLIVVIIVAVLCVRFGKTTKVFSKRLKLKKSTWVIAIILLAFFGFIVIFGKLGNWIAVFKLSSTPMIMTFCVALCAGIGEEFLMRNLAFNTCLAFLKNSRYSIFWSSVISSAVFGLIHLVNLTHQSWNATGQQVFYAFALGLIFMLIHVLTNNMKVTPIVHFLFDLQPAIRSMSVGESSWSNILIFWGILIVLSLISLWLINRDYLRNN